MNLNVPVMDGTAPQWAHSYARSMESLVRTLMKRIAELEARLAAASIP
jgi:hypothetical protein